MNIIDRLRQGATVVEVGNIIHDQLLDDAAAEIERLQAELSRQIDAHASTHARYRALRFKVIAAADKIKAVIMES